MPVKAAPFGVYERMFSGKTAPSWTAVVRKSFSAICWLG